MTRMQRAVAPLTVAGAAVLAACATLGVTVLAGTKTGVALALMAALGPLTLYAALCEPLVVPFAFFALLVPFDNLLDVSAFGTLTRLLAIACGAALLFWLLRTRRAVMPGRALWVWILYAMWAVVSLIWAIDASAGFAHLFTLFQLLSLYAVVSFMPIDRRTLGIVVAATIVSGVIAGLYGAYLFHHGIDVSANGRLFITADDNTIDPNQFAASLLVPIALAIVSLLGSRTLWQRLACIVALIAMGGGVAVAGSRGGLLAVLAIFVIIFVRMRSRMLAAGLGVGALGLSLALYGNVVSRFSNAAQTGGAGRVDIWRVGLEAFREHFWVGAGYSNFPIAFDQAFITVSEHYYTHWHRAPHNILISTGVELGVVGLGILLWAWWTQLRTMRAIDRSNPLFGLRTGLEAAVIGLFVASMFLDTLTVKYLWLAFMLCALVRNAALLPAKVPHERNVSAVLPLAAQRS